MASVGFDFISELFRLSPYLGITVVGIMVFAVFWLVSWFLERVWEEL